MDAFHERLARLGLVLHPDDAIANSIAAFSAKAATV
jgi:hypothetical protein